MLVLASNSPRRKDLLNAIGVDFTSVSPKVNEQVIGNELPEAYTRRLAQAKARAVQAQSGNSWKVGDMILAADTTVISKINGRKTNGSQGQLILGKPKDGNQAEQMLLRLRGRRHQVCTAIAVLDPVSHTVSEAIEYSTVTMRNYTMDEIKGYIASGDPIDKAGGYAIQHPTFQPVKRVSGCYPNVMGLPVCQVIRLVAKVDRDSRFTSLPACQKSEGPCWIYLEATRRGEDG